MTYSAQELSLHGGEPVELYQFVYATKAWRYTSADEQQTHLANLYTPAEIKRSSVDQSQDINRNNLKLDVHGSLDVAQLFIVYPPAEPLMLTIFRQHRTDAGSETVAIWQGRVLGVEWKNNVAVMTCESVFTSLKRAGLRRHYQASCPHVLYGTRCNVVKSSYETIDAVSSIAGNVVTVSAAASQVDGYYDGGVLVFVDGEAVTHKRAILDHTGQNLTLTNSIVGLTTSDNVTVIAGCGHNLSDCENKFNNLVNYGGFPFVPGVNPFNGSTIF